MKNENATKERTVVSKEQIAAAVQEMGLTVERLTEPAINEALTSNVGFASTLLDKRFIERLVVAPQNASLGDQLVAAVALRIDEIRSDDEAQEFLDMSHGRERALLSAAFAGEWKSGKSFVLSSATALEVHTALKRCEGVRKGRLAAQRRHELREQIEAAKAAIAQLETDGVDLFLADWGSAIKTNAGWALEVFEAARTGVWSKDGQSFRWDGRNLKRVSDALKVIDQAWERALLASAR